MSFYLGNKGESLWMEEIRRTRTDIEQAPKKKFYDWDVKAKYENKVVTYEVKYDNKGYFYAERHNRPVNLYVEFRNTNKGEDSGIKASKADYYVYILKSMDGIETAYVFNRLELLEHLEQSNYKIRGNKGGGDNNAQGWTPPLESLKQLLRKKVILNGSK